MTVVVVVDVVCAAVAVVDGGGGGGVATSANVVDCIWLVHECDTDLIRLKYVFHIHFRPIIFLPPHHFNLSCSLCIHMTIMEEVIIAILRIDDKNKTKCTMSTCNSFINQDCCYCRSS